MSKEIKLEGQQWYRDRDGEIYFCVGKCQTNRPDCYLVHDWAGNPYNVYPNGRFIEAEERSNDLVEHLPDCDSFNWEPPKPVVAPEGWRLLTEGETIFATDQWWEGRYWQSLSAGDFVVGGKWNSKDHYQMARKIEPKYRPFTWEEFSPHRDKWIIDAQDVRYRVGSYCNQGVQLTGVVADPVSYNVLFQAFRFEDGSMIGVEVTE